MSEPTTTEATATAAEATPTDPPATDPTPKPTETVEFWKGKAREQEKRAKENAEAAKRLAEIEDANKSEAQKAADRIAELERQAASATAEALRFKVASAHSISTEDAELFLTGTDEETLNKQAARLVERTPTPAAPRPDRSQGGKPTQAEGDQVSEFARNLFAASD